MAPVTSLFAFKPTAASLLSWSRNVESHPRGFSAMARFPAREMAWVSWKAENLTCWCSVGNDLPCLGNEPRACLKEVTGDGFCRGHSNSFPAENQQVDGVSQIRSTSEPKRPQWHVEGVHTSAHLKNSFNLVGTPAIRDLIRFLLGLVVVPHYSKCLTFSRGSENPQPSQGYAELLLFVCFCQNNSCPWSRGFGACWLRRRMCLPFEKACLLAFLVACWRLIK